MRCALNLTAIPAAKPFVDVLAHHVLARYGHDPLLLCRVLILLPSRRACRSLREAFLRASHGQPLLLPSIQPLGEVEEEELFFSDSTLAAEIAALPPAVAPMQRLFKLAEIIRSRYQSHLNLAQSLTLAEALGELLDDIHREQADDSLLADLVPADFARHWQVTHDFLAVAIREWKSFLVLQGCEDAVQRRNRLLALLARHWAKTPPPYPVIAAGSTGSIPAVAALLRVIAEMPEGMVVLAGLDQHADQAQWQALAPSHPQYGLAQLLQRMGVSHHEVASLDVASISEASNPARKTLFCEVLRPAETLPAWQHLSLDAGEATHNLHVLTCHTPHEEAQNIAVLLRQTLEEPGEIAAVITRDRVLARMIAAQMQRFGVSLNDSAGVPLSTTPAACFLRLIAECAVAKASPVSLLALLKHPYTRAGLPAGGIRTLVRRMEILALRGVRVPHGIKGLRQFIQKHRTPSAEVEALLERLEKASESFFAYAEQKSACLDDMLRAHLKLAEWLAESEAQSGAERLWEAQEGEFLASCIDDVLTHAHTLGNINPSLYAAFIDSILQRQTYRPSYNLHPRLHVLSPIEARLQHFDRVILAGLNENTWPPQTEHSPWLNRAMRKNLGLSEPEQRIGQSAHDFFMHCLGREVFITRSRQQGDSPLYPARWLVRLQALLYKLSAEALTNTHPYTQYAATLNNPSPMAVLLPPAPCPPSAVRPKRLSVTEIERLMRNPYVVYAKHVLRLRALDDIDMLPDAADFGQIVHRAIEQFVTAYPTALPENPRDELLACGRKVFAQWWDQPVVKAYWWPRFCDMAQRLAEQETQDRPLLTRVFSEVDAEIILALGDHTCTLTTRMDRLELTRDGSWNIIDYKTGAPPERSEVKLGIASQLPLEAMILLQGIVPEAIRALPRLHVQKLSYFKLAGAEQDSGEKDISPADDLIDQAQNGVRQLLEAFMHDNQPYHATPFPEREKDYAEFDHLIRRMEWDAVA